LYDKSLHRTSKCGNIVPLPAIPRKDVYYCAHYCLGPGKMYLTHTVSTARHAVATVCDHNLRLQIALSDDSPYDLPRNQCHVRAPRRHEAFAKRSTRLFRPRADDATFLSVTQELQKHLPMTTCLKGLRRLSVIWRRLLTGSGSP